MSGTKLNKRQEAAAQALIRLDDQTAAYKAAGYSYKNKSAKSINQSASRLFANVNVAARVQQLRSKVAEIAKKKLNIDAEEMLRHLDILRRARIDDYVEYNKGELSFKDFSRLTEEQLMCIESIKQNRYGEIELKLHGKEWTIEKINKHIGFYEKDNLQKSKILSPEEREAEIKKLESKMK